MKKAFVFLLTVVMMLGNCKIAYADQQDNSIKVNIADEDNLVASSAFSGKGKGTKEKPYEITSARQLDEIRNDLEAHYVLKKDIDLSSFYNWVPIGDYDSPFIGSFDGNGFTIKNLKIESMKSDYAGLFGYCSNSSIQNVNLSNVLISIDKKGVDYTENWEERRELYIGSIAAQADNIENCSVDGKISVNNCHDAYVGGVVACGKNIIGCVNKIDIYVISLSNNDSVQSNDSRVSCGGIAGCAGVIFGKIMGCVNYGNIDGISGNSMYCGGISGEDGEINQCKNYGDIKGKTANYVSYSLTCGNCNTGGIVGFMFGKTLNVVNYGNVFGYALKGGTSYAGGVAGCSYYFDGEMKNCINFCNSIISMGQLKKDEQYIDIFNAAGRIVGGTETYRSDLQNSYSLDTTLVNDRIPTENIGLTSINGESLSKIELEQKIKEIIDVPKTAVNMKQCKAMLLKESYTYTGKEIKPDPTVMYKNTKLQNGKAYSLSYKNNKEVGTATIQIKGKGAYTGTIELTFCIISKEQAKAEKNVAEVSTQYDKAEKEIEKKSEKLFKKLKNGNTKACKSIKKKIQENQLLRPLSIKGNYLPKEAYETFLNCYYEKIDDAAESNFSSYKDVKTAADLVNKISGELVSEDGEFTFQSMGRTYICKYKKVGGWGALWSPGKIVDEKTKEVYNWQAVKIRESDIKNEMKYLKEYAGSKIEEAKNACISEGKKALQINKLKSFLGKLLSKKGKLILEDISPDIVTYAKGLSKAVEQYSKLKKIYSNIANFDLSTTDYDKLTDKINSFNKLFEEWQKIVTELS